MVLQKKDFIEIEFTGRIKDTGEIFDSNIAKDLAKANLRATAKPFRYCLGEGMFLAGIDEFIEGKDIGEYEIEVSPEKAFGKRDAKMIQMIPIKFFRQQNVQPVPGAMFNFDGRIGKILTISGGRVITDFNHPLAGKQLLYSVKVLQKIEELGDKVNTLTDFLFRRQLNFEINGKKLILEVEKQMKDFVELFKDKFNEILGLELETKEIKSEKLIKGAKDLAENITKKVEEKVSKVNN